MKYGGRRFDLRKLLQWSWSDLPMVLAGLAAVLSWASTPELPVPRSPDHTIHTALNQQPQKSCRQMILDFNASMGVAAQERHETPLAERVRTHCHAAMNDAADPSFHALHSQLIRRQRNSSTLFPESIANSWRYDGLDLGSRWQSLGDERPPRLAYILLISPSDAATAVANLVKYLWAQDNWYIIHVDAKAPEHLHSLAKTIASSHSNICVLSPPTRVTWGGYSMVHVQVRALHLLLHHAAVTHWDYVINLSGQDLPLLRDRFLKQQLSGQGVHTNFVLGWRANWSADDGGWVECDDKMYRVVDRRAPPRSLQRAHGSQWFILPTYIYVYVCVYACMHVCMYACMYVCVYIQYLCVCVYVCVCVY